MATRRAKSRRRLRVAIIGAGLGGIAAAVYLKKHARADVVIYEAESSIGGTWYRNRFPGAEVDTPSHMYSYSFRPGDWTRPYAPQAELVRYMEAVVDEYGLADTIRVNTRVSEVRWNETERLWHVQVDGTEETYDAVVSAVGMLSDPKIPDWPGVEDFAGQLFHSAQWPEDADLVGKRVAVVGTGSTACQIVPSIAPIAGHVTLYQRQPSWVIPKAENHYSDERRAELRRTIPRLRLRFREFWRREKRSFAGRLDVPDSKADHAARASARGYIDRVFGDRPDLRAMVTPDYPYLGKRPVQSSEFYPALLRDDVELVPCAVSRIREHGVEDADGNYREVDVVVAATGFKAAQYLSTLPVFGRDGRSLQDSWAEEPRAYLGAMVPGFPNFFMLYGPNSNGFAVLFALEQQSYFAAKTLRRMLRHGGTVVEVKQRAFDRYSRWVDRRLATSSYTRVANYFTSPSGRVVTQWPAGVTAMWLMARGAVHTATTIGPRRRTGRGA